MISSRLKALIVSSLLCLSALNSAWADVDVGVTANKPSASPSGASIVFAADYDGQSGLWISSMDGKSINKITADLASDLITEPAWSADGQQIAFAARGGNGVTDIWLVRPDGTGLKQLTKNALNNSQPTWSPDSSQIAFSSNRGGSNDIWLMNSDGSNQRRVTKLPGQENHPSFSPDGTMLVFSEVVNKASTLMVVNVDGRNLRNLTTGTDRDRAPNWSRYGIVFASNRSADHWRIWKIQPDGTGLGLISNVVALDPNWLPDGRIIFGDEMNAPSGTLSAMSVLDPITGKTSLVNTVQGFQIPIVIRPGKPAKRINISSKGKIKVAILSTANFNAPSMVNQKTISFGKTGSENSLVNCSPKTKDVNNDKLPDLICSFRVRNTGFGFGDTVAVLRFQSIEGAIPFEGRDTIVTYRDDDKDDDTDND